MYRQVNLVSCIMYILGNMVNLIGPICHINPSVWHIYFDKKFAVYIFLIRINKGIDLAKSVCPLYRKLASPLYRYLRKI